MTRFRIDRDSPGEVPETTPPPLNQSSDDAPRSGVMRLRRRLSPNGTWRSPTVKTPLSVWRLLSWLFVVAIYVALGWAATSALEARVAFGSGTTDPDFGWAAVLLVLASLMACALACYEVESSRSRSASESLRGNSLFVLYGYDLHEFMVPVPLEFEWNGEQQEAFLERLLRTLNREFNDRMQSWNVAARSRRILPFGADVTPLDVSSTDGYGDHKEFVRLAFETSRGSHLTCLVHPTLAGKTVVLHVFMRFRGQLAWHDLVDFVLKSPGSLWFWIRPWIKGRLSLVTRISHFPQNSFDLMDLTSLGGAFVRVLQTVLESFLKDEGFAEEVVGQVVNVITNHQNFNIYNAQNVSGIGNVRVGGQGSQGASQPTG